MKAEGARIREQIEREARQPPETPDGRKSKGAGEELVAFARTGTLFQDSDGQAFWEPPGHTDGEAWPVKSRPTRDALTHWYFSKTQKPPNGSALDEALRTLESLARVDGQVRTVETRLAHFDGRIYVDLGTPSREAVEITPAGYGVVAKAPVHFQRPANLGPLPAPSAQGSLDDLDEFLNAETDRDRLKIKQFLIGCLMPPPGTFPILLVQGPEGSAKSTLTALLRRIVDPEKGKGGGPMDGLRGLPRKEDDFFIRASKTCLVGFDNVSELTDWQSDLMCRMTSGTTHSKRALHTDMDEVNIAVRKPFIINGIHEFATRADFLGRAVSVRLARMPNEKRLDEHTFWDRFDEKLPRILGALYRAAANALANRLALALPWKPRLADYALWVIAAEPACPWPAGDSLKAFQEDQAAAADAVVGNSELGEAILEFVQARTRWTGTPRAFYRELTDGAVRSKEWPKNEQGVSRLIGGLEETLRQKGVRFHRSRSTEKKWTFELVTANPTLAEIATGTPSDANGTAAPTGEDEASRRNVAMFPNISLGERRRVVFEVTRDLSAQETQGASVVRILEAAEARGVPKAAADAEISGMLERGELIMHRIGRYGPGRTP